jgi:Ankyrin repeats (3 copies)
LQDKSLDTPASALQPPDALNLCKSFVLSKTPANASGTESAPASGPSRPKAASKKLAKERELNDNRPPAFEDQSKQGVRFSMLPDHMRPEPTMPVRELDDERETYKFITPDPLDEPLISSDGAVGGENGEKNEPTTAFRIPKSSMVPSYFLASTNRFTRKEIDMLTPSAKLLSLVPPPLFVYGSLMFPSILRARAEQFIGAEGVYSQRHQRRLKTDANDWTRVNFSLQHAAEQMTPARLNGYSRFKPIGLSCAAIVKAGSEAPDTAVLGFLIFGLSEEALKCCDHLLSSASLMDIYKDKDQAELDAKDYFQRKTVKVDISVKGGDLMTIDAVTYAWVNARWRLDQPWDINKFVRGKSFNKLSGLEKGSFWMEEEKRLASTMGMTLVLSGDALCDAVLREDKSRLLELLDEGHDVNAPCTQYGSVLTAAAFRGQDEIVDFLIRRHANANAVGGEYWSPLIAATAQGHENCARSLLKAGADVLADGGKYVSAIYQAVDYGDEDLAHLLLEKGAWLTKDYRELLDLAAERSNRGITRMLEDYDVRKLYLLPARPPVASIMETDPNQNTGDSTGDQTDRERRIKRRSRDSGEDMEVTVKPLSVVRAVVLQALFLKGQRGKWTGIKGVKILRAALDVGVSEKILDQIRPHMSSYQKIVDYLGRAMVEMNQEQEAKPRQIQSESGASSVRRGETGTTSGTRRDDREVSDHL